ncbi:MAG TPA: hypothetical protein VK724_22955 [Bryobacteraceae bacterium]|jgi:hypothetical protein|nr:hypothetical protein [Bryobacteraceae bacterium]
MRTIQSTATRVLFGGTVAVVAFGFAASAQLAPVKPGPTPTEANMFIATPPGWVQPKTPWGDPDLEGIWPISYVGTVMFERCAGGFGPRPANAPPCDQNKAFLTEAEFKAIQDRAAKQPDRYKQVVKDGEAGRAFLAGVMDNFTPQRQTSLIMDPPDGKLPAMTPEGKRLSSLMKSSWPLVGEKVTFDTYTDFDSWDRCITRGLPASMFPFRYNNGLQIIQTPGYVALRMEMIHETRIVALNAPPVSPAIKEWLGISRGHWDGNTLVVETTNFKPGASATNTGVMGSPPGNRFPTSDQMKLTERFTRLNNDFLIYQITVEDPVVLTRSWTARFPLKLDNGFQILEYACTENNDMIPHWISTSRAERAQDAAKAAGQNKEQH